MRYAYSELSTKPGLTRPGFSFLATPSSLLRDLLNGTISLIDGGVSIGVGRSVGIRNGDAAKRFSGDLARRWSAFQPELIPHHRRRRHQWALSRPLLPQGGWHQRPYSHC